MALRQRENDEAATIGAALSETHCAAKLASGGSGHSTEGNRAGKQENRVRSGMLRTLELRRFLIRTSELRRRLSRRAAP